MGGSARRTPTCRSWSPVQASSSEPSAAGRPPPGGAHRILEALGLKARDLAAVRREHAPLPKADWDDCEGDE